ncbi:MAG: hypothetical protein HYY51_02525 [Candidatus Magasanikbacteria bacterium]|nr:hypothetical protein [Candidatus Magasanikbacteria bacterium]
MTDSSKKEQNEKASSSEKWSNGMISHEEWDRRFGPIPEFILTIPYINKPKKQSD